MVKSIYESGVVLIKQDTARQDKAWYNVASARQDQPGEFEKYYYTI